MNANLGEDLRRIRRLVGFHLHFVARDLLALLAQDADDVERRAAREGDGDEFDRLRSGVAGCVVDEEMVAGTASSNELPMIAEGLSQRYACRDHCVLRDVRSLLGTPTAHYIWATRINAVTRRTVTGILRGLLGVPNSGNSGSLLLVWEPEKQPSLGFIFFLPCSVTLVIFFDITYASR